MDFPSSSKFLLIYVGFFWPFGFSHIRDGMKLVNNGLHYSMEYLAATMIVSSHLGLVLVLSHCTE